MRRLAVAVALATSLVVPTAVLFATASGTAGAATAPSCKTLKGTAAGNFTISKCSPKNKQNKTASGSSVSLATGGGTINWSPSTQTTTVSVSFTQASDNTGCKNGATKYDVSGSVTGGSSTYTASGQSISAEVCLAGSNLSLAKGTVMTL
jgi:pectin methylesterase-like acyl-CoA thioesterase